MSSSRDGGITRTVSRLNPIQTFEQAFAAYTQTAAARGFWRGRAGLYALLRALPVTPGDRVGICAYTCVSVVEAIVQAGASPLFLDVDEDLNIAPAALLRLNEPPKALILQHTFGMPCALEPCLAWARTHRVPVIEDCCHALGARYDDRLVGSFGCAALYSFQWGKPFSTGEGGMVTFNDATLAQAVDAVVAAEGSEPEAAAAALLALKRSLHRLSTPGLRRQLKRLRRGAPRTQLTERVQDETPRSLTEPLAGYCRTMSAGQARVGLARLRGWPQRQMDRDANARRVRQRLRDAGVALREPDPRKLPMYLRVPVRVDDKAAVLAEARRRNLDIAGWYESPVHPYGPAAARTVGYRPDGCPGAESAFRHVVTLPTQYRLVGAALDETVQAVTMHDA